MAKRVYYIGGRSYSPDDATRLCAHAGIFETVTLYRTDKGRFFIVTEGVDSHTAKVLTESEARAFMDEHPGGIVTKSYNVIFGKPERG